MSTLVAWALSFGCAVGWGAFVVPGTVFLPTAGPLGTAIGMAIGAFALGVIAQNYRFMACRSKTAGGAFEFAKMAFGDDHGFVAAWFIVITYFAILWANTTAVVFIIRHLCGPLLQFGFTYSVMGYDVWFGEAAFCSATVLLAALLCVARTDLAIRALVALALLAFGGIVATFAMTVAKTPGPVGAMAPYFSSGAPLPLQILAIIALVPWAFVGFEAVSHSSERFAFPSRRVFGVMACALAAGALSYIMLTFIPAMSPPGGFASWTESVAAGSAAHPVPSAAGAEQAIGPLGTALVIAAMTGAIGTTLIGNTLTLSRIMRAMSENGMLPDGIAKRGRNGRPCRAILIVGCVSAVIPFMGRTIISVIVDINSIGAAIAYGYTSAAAFKFARDERRRGAAAAGAAGVVISAIFLTVLLVPSIFDGAMLSTESYLVLGIWGMLGLIHFRRVFANDTEKRFGRSTVVWGALLALIFSAISAWQFEAARDASRSMLEHIRRARESVSGSGMSGEDADRFVAGELKVIEDGVVRKSAIQAALLAASLALMVNLYSTLRRRETEMERRKIEAEETSRAKNAFLANVSHDMRTPLNAIIGFAGLARTDEGLTRERMRDYAAKIEAAGDSLLRFVDDILELRKLESGTYRLRPAPCDVAALMDGVRDLFATQAAARHLDFHVACDGLEHRRVVCDGQLLKRVVSNLTGNAIKYTPPGGRVSVTLDEGGEAEPGFAAYTFTVSDTGIGMSREFASKVFDAFTREEDAASQADGAGLGMSIARNIVEMMGGTIGLETEKGKGSVFTVKVAMPVAGDEGGAPGGDAGIDAGRTSGSTERGGPPVRSVLVAEDNEINREIVGSLLESRGIRYVMAADGSLAVSTLASSAPGTFDAVLMDMRMPVMNGVEATRAIRAMSDPSLSRIPVIALSADAANDADVDASGAGFDGFVSKPVRIDALLEAITEAMRRREASDEANGQMKG